MKEGAFVKNYFAHCVDVEELAGLFGADLMLAAATTFGTTAAGVSISSLSGAAATNAILAWLKNSARGKPPCALINMLLQPQQ